MKFKMDYKWVALSVTSVGTFMSALDSSIVVIGLPTVLQNLHASIAEGVWIITGYRLMLTLLLVLLGRLADLHGRVKLYNSGFVIFTIGSLLCALSRTNKNNSLERNWTLFDRDELVNFFIIINFKCANIRTKY